MEVLPLQVTHTLRILKVIAGARKDTYLRGGPLSMQCVK